MLVTVRLEANKLDKIKPQLAIVMSKLGTKMRTITDCHVRTQSKNRFSDNNNVTTIRDMTVRALEKLLPQAVLVDLSAAIQGAAMNGHRCVQIHYHPSNFQIVHLLELNGFKITNIESGDPYASCCVNW